MFNRDARDVERSGSNQRPELDAHLDRLGGEERRLAECRIVGNGESFGRERSVEQRKAQTAEVDFASKRCGRLLLDGRAELIDGDQKWRNRQEHDDHAADCEADSKGSAHMDSSPGQGWPEHAGPLSTTRKS